MTLNAFLASALLVMAGTAHSGNDHAHDDHKPMHGGIVAPGNAFDAELVAKPTLMQLYLRDHGRPFDTSKASAKLTLLTGREKQDVQLKPVGDKLEAAGSFTIGPGTKVVAVVTVAGKPATARFTLK